MVSNTDDSKLFDLVKIVFGVSSLWAHAKIFSRDRDGRDALRAIRENQLGTFALDARHTESGKIIRSLAYFGERSKTKWHNYVVAHKRCHKIQLGLEEHNFHDFTNREKVTFLLDGIRVNTLEAPILSITMDSSYREDFEKAQLQITECIRMAMIASATPA